jgi:hypothetical protein
MAMFFIWQLCSVDDHHQEVIGFCRDNSFHGILAEEAEYAIFDPPRYFSSKQLKLTYKVSVVSIPNPSGLIQRNFLIVAGFIGNKRVYIG